MALDLPQKTTDLSIAADAAHAVNPWVALAYLVAGVCFIIALRGLSSPSTSRRGNRFGMVGMLIAVATTLITTSSDAWVVVGQSVDGGRIVAVLRRGRAS